MTWSVLQQGLWAASVVAAAWSALRFTAARSNLAAQAEQMRVLLANLDEQSAQMEEDKALVFGLVEELKNIPCVHCGKPCGASLTLEKKA
jgi:hypothetical protein